MKTNHGNTKGRMPSWSKLITNGLVIFRVFRNRYQQKLFSLTFSASSKPDAAATDQEEQRKWILGDKGVRVRVLKILRNGPQ
jgi:hypothetical protein